MLGSVQVRPNSERLTVDGIPLVRGSDYTVDYDLGRVAFARPDTLFPRPRQVAVQFEENPVFAETPSSIIGASAEFPLTNGSVSFMAISQTQNTTYNRPPLGLEPAASLVAGVTAQFGFEASALTSLVSRLPFGTTTVPSRINFAGEFAASRPKPNAAGQAFVESFGSEGGLLVPLADNQWYYSSQPAHGREVPACFGAGVLDLARASTMAWQSDGLDARGARGAGGHVGRYALVEGTGAQERDGTQSRADGDADVAIAFAAGRGLVTGATGNRPAQKRASWRGTSRASPCDRTRPR